MSDEVARAKIEPGLLVTATSTVLPDVSWAKLPGSEVLVRALVVADSSDISLASLRSHVVSLGGTVHYNYELQARRAEQFSIELRCVGVDRHEAWVSLHCAPFDDAGDGAAGLTWWRAWVATSSRC